jgi:hypothetical protein
LLTGLLPRDLRSLSTISYIIDLKGARPCADYLRTL